MDFKGKISWEYPEGFPWNSTFLDGKWTLIEWHFNSLSELIEFLFTPYDSSRSTVFKNNPRMYKNLKITLDIT